jgi:CxxC motif-containing protein (DUF1111 family)
VAFAFGFGCRTLDDSPGDEDLSTAGRATVRVSSRHAFAKSVPNLRPEQLERFAMGNHLFNRRWITAPASLQTFDGLGPLFNRVSCSGCHTRDGRGQPPASADAPMRSMLVRLSISGVGANGGPKPHPAYGTQLQDRAIHGIAAEGRMAVTYREVVGYFGDGTQYTLREPVYEFVDSGYGPLGDDVLYSPRVAPAVFGTGLLELVPEEALLVLADEEDADGDGISGKMNRVWHAATDALAFGRFGWKAGQPTVEQQTAGAFVGDIGITSSIFPEETLTGAQEAAALRPRGGTPELEEDFLDDIVFYLQTLAVPARRPLQRALSARGRALFDEARCSGCHVPELRTGTRDDVPQLSEQVIHPYTDLLLHDLGEGLADHRPEFLATGREWRTPPLWGVGLIPVVNGHNFLLHDGRARGVAEAILWHGGEAEPSQEFFRQLPPDDREALVRFVESL